MATRLQYRQRLEDKILGLEDEGWGDFEYGPTELNTYLELAVARLYPAIYKTAATAVLTSAGYGNGRLGSVSTSFADRVFMVEDAIELATIYGWKTRAGKVVGLNVDYNPTVIAYYYDAYTLPNDDIADAGIPAIYTPLIVLGALIEAMESRHDQGERPDPSANTRQGHELSLLDRLSARYDALKNDLTMSLPALVV